MNRRLKVLALVMGLMLLFHNVASIHAAEDPPGKVEGDLDCLNGVVDIAIGKAKTSSTTMEFKGFGVFNLSKKCVINGYVQRTNIDSMPLYAGKQNKFNVVVNLASASSNTHEGSITLDGYMRPYFLVIK